MSSRNEKKPKKGFATASQFLTTHNWTAEDFDLGSSTEPPKQIGTQPITPLGTVSNTTANMTTPLDRTKIQQVLQNPEQVKAAEGPVAAATGFLAKLFDYSDTQDNPIEWAWDGTWRTLGWGYDRINQGASWAVSAAPGGTQTFSWDQAGQISYGQASLAAGAENVTEYGPLGQALNLVTSPFSLLGGVLAQGDMAGPLGQEGFDVTDAEDRKAAFEESAVGKWASGLSDAVFSTVADPLLFAGKFSSLAKLKYLDDIYQGSKGIDRLRADFVASAGKDMAEKAPIAQFAARSAAVDPVTGKKVLSHREIATRLRGATGQDELASALYHNDDEHIAELIMRYGFNDIQAGEELAARRPALGLAIVRKQREKAMEIIAREPEQRIYWKKQALDSATALDAQMKTVAEGSDTWNQLRLARDNAQETYSAIVDNRLHEIDNVVTTPEVEALLARELDDLIAHNETLSKFLGDEVARISETSNSFVGSTRGFSVNNKFGRAVEKSRMNRVEKAVQTAETRGAMKATGRKITLENGSTADEMRRLKIWDRNEFGANGFTRAVRVWRWFGEENPSGFITTKGTGALDSWREVKAVLDDVDIYSGQARTITLKDGKTITVGGLDNKNKMIGWYMDAVRNNTAGNEAAQVALARIEDQIFNDISAWHGIKPEIARELKAKAAGKRDQVMSDLADKNKAFWIDDDGTKNKAPWLESQIQNGTYMLNYRSYNKLARMHSESPFIKNIDEKVQFVGDNAKNAYDMFNELWRPAVLMRLGYTQRNVMEGLFRSTAYAFSLDPIRMAAVQAGLSPRNAYMKYAVRKAADRAEAVAKAGEHAASGLVQSPRYTKWLTNEIKNRDLETLKFEEYISTPGKLIDDTSQEAKDFMLEFYKGQEKRYLDAHAAARKAGAGNDELSEIKHMADRARAESNRVAKISSFTGETTESMRTLDQLRYLNTWLSDSVARRQALNNPLTAADLFRQQGAAKRRVFDGVIQAPDGTVLAQAFNPDTGYADIALSNLSADGTTRSMSISAGDTYNSAIRAYRKKNYVDVKPDDPTYFSGVASTLAQMKFSDLGARVIRGDSLDDIANFLYRDSEGRQIFEFIVHGENAVGRSMELTQDAAYQIAAQTRTRYMEIAPSPELQEYMRGITISKDFYSGETVKNFLTKSGADGTPLYELKPVVGHIAEELGTKSARQAINQITQTGLKWLGTIPEDAFVRAPFYGKRYEETLKQSIRNLQEQIGENGQITWREYQIMMRSAHRRALKDTREWMFTIERRTNLGTYGEIAIPFISATQNSVTTVGRLLWKDPTVGVLMSDLYRAPDKIGLKDEEGNIVIPIPHALLPDGLEKRLGIENQNNLKFSLSSLNLIYPQLEQGTLFQFGPVVAVPTTMFVNAGIFGTPDTPAPMKAIPGGEALWNLYKDHTFGSGGSQGIPTDILTSLFPSTANRVIQLFQKTDNRTYATLYNANMHAEILKWRAGLRDEPTKAEITTMTDNLTMVKLFANAGFAFPPQYEGNLGVVTDLYTSYQNKYGDDADKMFVQNYGADLLIAKNLGMSKSPVQANEGMATTARRYDSLISGVAAELADRGDLSVLSVLFNDNPNALFDGSIYSWQMSNNIPGVSELWRQRLTPEEALLNDSKNAGWTKSLQYMEQLDARLASMGLTSYDYAPGLKAEKDNFIAGMAADPMYSAWARDWQENGASRTTSTVMLMQSALKDPTFVKDHAESPVWSAASQYLQARAQVQNALLATGGGSIDSNLNSGTKQWWDSFRANLKNTIPSWGPFANRFLDGDDDPQNPGISFGTTLVGGQ